MHQQASQHDKGLADSTSTPTGRSDSSTTQSTSTFMKNWQTLREAAKNGTLPTTTETTTEPSDAETTTEGTSTNNTSTTTNSSRAIVPKAHSVIKIDFDKKNSKRWKAIIQPPKMNLVDMFALTFNDRNPTNVHIGIGTTTFDCHLMVLQSYSEFFMGCDGIFLIKLPEEKVTLRAFGTIYDWMVNAEPMLEREGIIEVLVAAEFLKIKRLLDKCWVFVDDDKRFTEDQAYLLYLEAIPFNLEAIKHLMLLRIMKYFMSLVATDEFLDMPCADLGLILSSNAIAVNSEIEVFLAAIRWLHHDWSERKKDTIDVIKHVRFSRLPMLYLISLMHGSECPEINSVVIQPEIKKMIDDSISFQTTRMYNGIDRERFLGFLDNLDLTDPPKPRLTIFDVECEHHHANNCHAMLQVTYRSFLEYLKIINTTRQGYWRSLEVGDFKSPKPCCAVSNQSTEQNYE